MKAEVFHCWACSSTALTTFYEVKDVPIHSCLLVDSRSEALEFPRGDLSLAFCSSCGFIQNNHFDPAVHSYSPAYEETQAFSPRFRRFQTELCKSQIEKHNLRQKTVLEIGCGKGDFLVELCELGDNHGIGIDPGYRPDRTRSSAAARIRFIQDFYTEIYDNLRSDYIACRHTLEHIQPVQEFVSGIRESLENRPKIPVFFELPDVERVLQELAFWDLYYEHCSYFTLGSLARLFQRAGFDIVELSRGFEDQYLLLDCKPGTGALGPVPDDLADIGEAVDLFRVKIADELSRLQTEIENARRAGRRIALWGSGSKAVSFLTTLQLQDEIQYVVDINPYKQGKYLAGSGHAIVAPRYLAKEPVDLIYVMNPIYQNEIAADLEHLGVRAELRSL